MQMLSAYFPMVARFNKNSLSLDKMSHGSYPFQFSEFFLQLGPFIPANLFTQILNWKTQYIIHNALCRSSRSKLFFKIGVLKNFEIFTGIFAIFN